MKGGSFKMPHTPHVKPTVKFASASKIHPAAQVQTRVRLPDSSAIGADPAPVVPGAGRI